MRILIPFERAARRRKEALQFSLRLGVLATFRSRRAGAIEAARIIRPGRVAEMERSVAEDVGLQLASWR